VSEYVRVENYLKLRRERPRGKKLPPPPKTQYLHLRGRIRELKEEIARLKLKLSEKPPVRVVRVLACPVCGKKFSMGHREHYRSHRHKPIHYLIQVKKG